MRNYYDILDVPRDATAEQIKGAYRFQLKAFHPDKFSPGSDHAQTAQNRIHQIIEAYNTLSNASSRAEYDRFLNHTSPVVDPKKAELQTTRHRKTIGRAMYVSAAEGELDSAKKLVLAELQSGGGKAVSRPAGEDLRQAIRGEIDRCRAVVQLVGQSFGTEPPTVDPTFGRVSYTQYEAVYARQRRKIVHYILLSDQFPSDEFAHEPEELSNLQKAYRRRIQIVDSNRYPSVEGVEALKHNVRTFMDSLGNLSRWKRILWIPLAAAILVLIGVWFVPTKHSLLLRKSETLTPGPTEVKVVPRNSIEGFGPVAKTESQSKPAIPVDTSSPTSTGTPSDSDIPDGSSFGITEAGIKRTAQDTLTLRLSVKSRSGAVVDQTKTKIQVFFYDLLDDKEVGLTDADVEYEWLTPHHDWKDANPEILAVKYIPGTEARTSPSRRYLGYIVRVYYDGHLQAARADPEKLLNLFPPPFSVPSSDSDKSSPAPLTSGPEETTSNFAMHAMRLREQALLKVEPQVFVPRLLRASISRFPWKTNIVTTVSWIGEKNNTRSAWDANWMTNYGGVDTPDPRSRRNYIPVAFVPRQNPFYCGLPYNDVTHGQFKPEAALVIPWFKKAYTEPGRSVCKDRWLAIRKGNRTCYAQWEDCGPFRNDHFQYVFQNERPKPNENRGAGLNVSPAVRDYLGLSPTDATDWQFVEVRDVPPGPWRNYGDNNHFVIAKRMTEPAPPPKPMSAEESRREATRMKNFAAARETHVAWELEQKKDYLNAAKLYQEAADQNNPDAQTNLAKLYLSGKGVQRDSKKAKLFLERASAQGHEEAKEILNVLSAQSTLNPDQVKAVRQKADQAIAAIRARDWAALAQLIHPKQGVRISPVANIQPDTDRVFRREEIVEMETDKLSTPTYTWGYSDRDDESPLSLGQYMRTVVWDRDYSKADRVSLNEDQRHSGGHKSNAPTAYRSCIRVEYYVEPTAVDSKDWGLLRLALEQSDGQFYVVGIINDRWSP